MVIAGTIVTILGLIGLIYCGVKAFQAKKLGLEGEELSAYLQKLIPVNMLALFGSIIGLALITIGIIL